MRASGVTPQFQSPSRQVPSRMMWVIIALCIILPPFGLILLWSSARNPLRGKLIISIIALLSMTLMIALFLLSRQPNPYEAQQVVPTASPQPQQQQQVQTAQPVVTNVPTDIPGTQSPTVVDVIPANPAQ